MKLYICAIICCLGFTTSASATDFDDLIWRVTAACEQHYIKAIVGRTVSYDDGKRFVYRDPIDQYRPGDLVTRCADFTTNHSAIERQASAKKLTAAAPCEQHYIKAIAGQTVTYDDGARFIHDNGVPGSWRLGDLVNRCDDYSTNLSLRERNDREVDAFTDMVLRAMMIDRMSR